MNGKIKLKMISTSHGYQEAIKPGHVPRNSYQNNDKLESDRTWASVK